MQTSCPFCSLPASRILAEDGSCVMLYDGYPVSEGHTLIVPRRHVSSFRLLTPEEWQAIARLSQRQAARLQEKDPTITGFNFGFNDGIDAGQTVFHAHAHLIPRRHGDHPTPRGGIRAVLPNKAHYGR